MRIDSVRWGRFSWPHTYIAWTGKATVYGVNIFGLIIEEHHHGNHQWN
jgi:hypothetical protein